MPTEEAFSSQTLYSSFQTSLLNVSSGRIDLPSLGWGGGEQSVTVDVNEAPSPAIFIIQIVGISSFLGKYGLGKTVKTFTLLPGESTTISTRTWRATSTTTALGSCIIDSFDETSRDTFASSVMNETTDTSTKSKTENWHAEGEASASWGWGSAKVSGGGSGEYSSSTEEFAKAVDETAQEHAAEASAHRESTVTSSSESSVSTEDETVIERTLKNINVRRVLNFVFRELNQEYLVKTHLKEVRIAFSNGQSGSWREVPLSGLRTLLAEVIDSTKIDEVAANILKTIAVVFDYQDKPITVIEKVTVEPTASGIKWVSEVAAPDVSGNYAAPAADGSTFYRFRRGVLGQSDEDNQVPGVLLKQRDLVLATDSIAVDALLGVNDALDVYSMGLQEAAIMEKELANSREELAQDIVKNKDADMAALFVDVFNSSAEEPSDETPA